MKVNVNRENKKIQKVIEIDKSCIKDITLTLSLEEAAVLVALTGRCNGRNESIGNVISNIYFSLSKNVFSSEGHTILRNSAGSMIDTQFVFGNDTVQDLDIERFR